MAEHLAFGSDMTVDTARKLLATAPDERSGPLGKAHTALFGAALRGAGINPQTRSVLGLTMASEAVPAIRNEPGRETAGPVQIDARGIFERRRLVSSQARAAAPDDRPAA